MNIWERTKLAWAIFRRSGGLELPDTGRSSVETLGGSMAAFSRFFGEVSPVIDFEMLATLKRLYLFNPDLSQYVANIVNLGNSGHKLMVDAASDATAEAAVSRLNETASRIYRHGVGVDGLINQYLASVAWSGAVSSEDVVNIAGGRVEKVVLVPVEQIRFVYDKETDECVPYQKGIRWSASSIQKAPFGLIPLNAETYRYYALSTVENSPYAKPPATAAIHAILEGQIPIMENIRKMAQKIGLLGLTSASVVPPPKKPNETDAEYQGRAKTYLARVREALSDLTGGLVVGFRDQKIEHTSVTTGASGVYDLNRISEEQVFSGMAAMPGFHGRTDATTESFADVVYHLLTAQVANMQRVVKRRQERTYMLDLRLGGFDVDSVRVNFNRVHSRNALAEARTERLRQNIVFDKVRNGLILPDEGAQELGYETWADPLGLGEQETRDSLERKTLTLRFDRAAQQYRFEPERLTISGGDEAAKVLPFIKKKTDRLSAYAN